MSDYNIILFDNATVDRKEVKRIVIKGMPFQQLGVSDTISFNGALYTQLYDYDLADDDKSICLYEKNADGTWTYYWHYAPAKIIEV